MKLHELLLPGFKGTVQIITHVSRKRFPSEEIFRLGFLWFFLILLSYHGFASEPEAEVVPENIACRQFFRQYIPSLNPKNPNHLKVIRDKLETKQNIGGSVTLNMEQPLNPALAEKLRKFLIIKMRTIRDLNFPYSLEHTLRQSGFFPPEEIIEIIYRLNRYFEQIKQIILQIDGRSVKLSGLEIRAENASANHRHQFRSQRLRWITATQALIGSGSLYETIHNNEKQTALVKTGEILFLSEPYRMHALSGTPKQSWMHI